MEELSTNTSIIIAGVVIAVLLVCLSIKFIVMRNTGPWYIVAGSRSCRRGLPPSEYAQLYTTRGECEAAIPSDWFNALMSNTDAQSPLAGIPILVPRIMVDGVVLVFPVEGDLVMNLDTKYTADTQWPVIVVNGNDAIGVPYHIYNGTLVVKTPDTHLHEARKCALVLDIMRRVFDLTHGVVVCRSYPDERATRLIYEAPTRGDFVTLTDDFLEDEHSDLLDHYAHHPRMLSKTGLTMTHIEVLNTPPRHALAPSVFYLSRRACMAYITEPRSLSPFSVHRPSRQAAVEFPFTSMANAVGFVMSINDIDLVKM